MSIAQTLENPQVIWTTAIFLITAGLAFYMRILEAKPKETLNTRLVPTTPIMFISMIVAILALVHLVNLFGVPTGR